MDRRKCGLVAKSTVVWLSGRGSAKGKEAFVGVQIRVRVS